MRIFLHLCQMGRITLAMATEESNIPQFEPWVKYSDLTQERLSIVAEIIRRVRHEAVMAHEPDKGDTNWDLGCRVYSRTCFALRIEAPNYPDWLTILPETKMLQFSFAIGTVPFRFYRGTPDDPPDRYVICSFGELHHQQMCLELEGLRPSDNVLRIAVETSRMTLEVTHVSVVEVDTAGNPIGAYLIPPVQRTAAPVVVITPQTAPPTAPVELAPPPIEPLEKIEEVAEAESQNGEETKGPKADTSA